MKSKPINYQRLQYGLIILMLLSFAFHSYFFAMIFGASSVVSYFIGKNKSK